MPRGKASEPSLDSTGSFLHPGAGLVAHGPFGPGHAEGCITMGWSVRLPWGHNHSVSSQSTAPLQTIPSLQLHEQAIRC